MCCRVASSAARCQGPLSFSLHNFILNSGIHFIYLFFFWCFLCGFSIPSAAAANYSFVSPMGGNWLILRTYESPTLRIFSASVFHFKHHDSIESCSFDIKEQLRIFNCHFWVFFEEQETIENRLFASPTQSNAALNERIASFRNSLLVSFSYF